MGKFTLLVLASSCAFSQLKAQTRDGLWLSPGFTIGGGTMTGVAPTRYTPETSSIFSIGLDGAWMFNDRLGVGTGLHYGAVGFNWSSSSVSINEQYKTGQAGLDVPVFVRLVMGQKGRLVAHGGFINSFFLNAEKVFEVDGKEVSKVENDQAKKDFSKYSIMPFIYVGGNVPMGKKVQATLGPQISYQLNNNFSDVSGFNGHYFLFALKIGFTFRALAY